MGERRLKSDDALASRVTEMDVADHMTVGVQIAEDQNRVHDVGFQEAVSQQQEGHLIRDLDQLLVE